MPQPGPRPVERVLLVAPPSPRGIAHYEQIVEFVHPATGSEELQPISRQGMRLVASDSDPVLPRRRRGLPLPWTRTLTSFPATTGLRAGSTVEQNPDLQVDKLTAAGCWKVWIDPASRTVDRRPQLDDVLEQLRPGDTLGVCRLGRSLRHLIDMVTVLDERVVGFRSPRESTAATTAGGRLVFHLFGALAQFSVISTRREPNVSAVGAAA